MLHRHVLECIDRTLRDLRSNDLPFGGLVVICAGDFRQCLPVVPQGSAGEILGASLFSSKLWERFDVFPLRTNMRLRRMIATLSEQKVEEINAFAEYLLRVGDGEVPSGDGDVIPIPEALQSRAMRDIKVLEEARRPKLPQPCCRRS